MERMFDDMEKHPEDSRNNWEMDCESYLCSHYPRTSCLIAVFARVYG